MCEMDGAGPGGKVLNGDGAGWGRGMFRGGFAMTTKRAWQRVSILDRDEELKKRAFDMRHQRWI